MMPAIPISEALADANLLGSALGDVGRWRTWRTILKAAFAEALTDEERALFALVAGGRVPPLKRVRELTILAIMTWVASPKPESDSATPARGTIYLPQHWNAY